METITIKIPLTTAHELLNLVSNSNETGNEWFDEQMNIVKKELEKKL